MGWERGPVPVLGRRPPACPARRPCRWWQPRCSRRGGQLRWPSGSPRRYWGPRRQEETKCT
eukprot:4757083-Pyramimonas_sp.AAC.1